MKPKSRNELQLFYVSISTTMASRLNGKLGSSYPFAVATEFFERKFVSSFPQPERKSANHRSIHHRNSVASCTPDRSLKENLAPIHCHKASIEHAGHCHVRRASCRIKHIVSQLLFF